MKRIIARLDAMAHQSATPHARAALQLYTVRDALAENRDRTLHRIREFGFTAVETAGFADELPSAASRQELAGYGLEPIASYFVGDLGRFGDHLDEQLRSENDTVIVGLAEDLFQDRDGLVRAADLINGMASQCEERGVRLGYHNHSWEAGVVDGSVALDFVQKQIAPDVFLEFDFYWAQVGGLAIEDAGRIFGGRLERLHLKDGPLSDSQVATVFGRGAFDIPSAVAAAPQAAWHVIAFDEFNGDLLEASGEDLSYLGEQSLSAVAR